MVQTIVRHQRQHRSLRLLDTLPVALHHGLHRATLLVWLDVIAVSVADRNLLLLITSDEPPRVVHLVSAKVGLVERMSLHQLQICARHHLALELSLRDLGLDPLVRCGIQVFVHFVLQDPDDDFNLVDEFDLVLLVRMLVVYLPPELGDIVEFAVLFQLIQRLVGGVRADDQPFRPLHPKTRTSAHRKPAVRTTHPVHVAADPLHELLLCW